MRVVGEIEAHRVARAPIGIDPERADLPIAGDCTHQEEDQDQPRGKQEESEATAPLTFRFLARSWRAADRRSRYNRCRRGADWHGRGHGFLRGADRRCGQHRFRRGDDWLYVLDGLCGHRRGGGDRIRYGRFRVCRQGFNRRASLDHGRATRQLLQPCPRGTDWRRYRRGGGDGILNRRRRQASKPIVQLGLVGRILWLGSTPREEAHLRPTVPPSDYDPYFTRGRSAMPL